MTISASPKVSNAPTSTNNDYRVKTSVDASGIHTQHMIIASGLVPSDYDYIELSYTGADNTGAIYKRGGASGTTVATLTMTYIAGVLQTVTKT